MKKENGKFTYEVELENGTQQKTVIFDESGSVINEHHRKYYKNNKCDHFLKDF